MGLRVVADAAGTPLPEGNEVRVGSFIKGFDPAAHTGDLMALQSAWVEFDRAGIRGLFDQAGGFAALATRDLPVLAGQRLYLWVFQTHENGPVAAQFGNVLACGLYSSSAANWLAPAPDALPPANATALLSSEVEVALQGHVNATSLTLEELPRHDLSYEQWAQARLRVAGADPAPYADPDHDGLVNLAEYAHDSNPLLADSSSITVKRETLAGVDSLTWTFPRRHDRPDAFISVQSSIDLINWSSEGITEAILSDTPVVQIVRASVPIQHEHRFLKLQASPR